MTQLMQDAGTTSSLRAGGLSTDGVGGGRLVDIESDEYAAALEEVPHDAYHTPGYVQQHAELIGGRPVAFVYSGGASAPGLLVLPLVLSPIPVAPQWFDAVSPYGYPAPVASSHDDGLWDAALAALTVSLRESGVIACFVRLHPLLPANGDALARAGTLVRHGGTVWVDVAADEQAGRAALRVNHRRQIDRARRAGLTTMIDDWRHLPEFVEVYLETMRRVGAEAFYAFDESYFSGLRAALGSSLHLATVHAEPGAEVLGGGLFLRHGSLLQYHLGATRTAHLGRQPAKLMMDDVRRWGRAQGATVLHLGGGLGGREDDSLFHFKAGFGPQRAPFSTWRLVTDPTAYRGLVRRTSGDREDPGDDDGRGDGDAPGAHGGFFPAYRRVDAAAR